MSSSHQWRSSSTSRAGRPADSTTLARPSKNRWRCQASAIGRGRAMGSAPAGGTSRSTSRAHTGSSRSRADRSGGLRSHSDTGASASRPRAGKQRARIASDPARWTSEDSSSSSRLLPTPASPVTRTKPACPAMAWSQRSSSSARSRSRPTSRSGLTAETGRTIRAGAAAGAKRAIAGGWPLASRSYSAVVARSGATPSSRSRIEVHRW